MATSNTGEAMSVDVLFEDDYLLAVSKPAGVVAHPCYKHADGTLFDALVAHLGATGIRPHLLQRLDKHTSGVVLVSKSPVAHARIIAAMGRARTSATAFRKQYLAVVWGRPEPASGEIALKLQRDASDTRRVAASATDGKESLTRYRTLDSSLIDRDTSLWMSLVECELLTGRMHQARVHLAARGLPIVGDPVYGIRPAVPLPPFIEQFSRQALHAWCVSFEHPVTRHPLSITAPIPADMRILMEQSGIRAPH